jgi:tetratricopeptide (TPR) repeat protein
MTTISLCVVTRDDAPTLARCIASAQDLVDEMVVLDTGVLNGAAEWALRAGARLIPFQWTGDAAAARTALVRAATGDWILLMEAEEALAPGSADAIRLAIQTGGIDCGYLPVFADSEADPAGVARVPRLLRRTVDLRWDGGEPESVAGWIAMRARRVRAVEAPIIRHGISETDQTADSAATSAAIAAPAATETDTDAVSTIVARAWDCYHSDDLEGTRAAIEAAWTMIDGHSPHALQVATLRAHVHIVSGDPASVSATVAQARAWGIEHPNLFMVEGVAAEALAARAVSAADRRTGLQAARQAFEACINHTDESSAKDSLPGVTTWAAQTRLGSVLMGLGMVQEAAAAFDTALKTDPEHAEAGLGKLEALLEDGQAEVIMNALMPFMEANIADGWMLAAAACEQMGRIEDALLFVGRANELAQDGMVVAKHRLLRMQDLISMAGVYVGRPVSGPGRWGAIGAILARDPLPGHAEVFPVNEAMIVRVVTHFVAAGWTDMIEAMLEPRAEQIAPGISETVVRTLQAHGAEVVDDKLPEPVFIGGAWDSGIGVLQSILDVHHRMHAGPEVKLVPILCSLRDEWWQGMGPDLEAAGVGEAELDAAVSAFVHQLIGGNTYTDKRVVESTPHNLLHMHMLSRLFPRARFVHLVRDGRDVAASLVQRDWMDPATGEKVWCCQDIGAAARYWGHVVSAVREQAELLPGRYLEIRYEDLVAQPEFVLRHVTAFLGEAWDPSMLSAPTAATPTGKALSAEDMGRIVVEAENALQTFGYLASHSPDLLEEQPEVSSAPTAPVNK